MNLQALKPSVWIGKRGLADTQIKEIKAQLDKKNLIKIKVLKNALGNQKIKEMSAQIADAANAEIVSQTGLIIVLRKKNGR
ncbi:MAG TPA: YhbY family RNA-binding protein [Candidatus Nanoarchaeia archaeon]|nr:YhbY family RNA-binding protein [Candidatus Nanoarchaeia archaeon]